MATKFERAAEKIVEWAGKYETAARTIAGMRADLRKLPAAKSFGYDPHDRTRRDLQQAVHASQDERSRAERMLADWLEKYNIAGDRPQGSAVQVGRIVYLNHPFADRCVQRIDLDAVPQLAPAPAGELVLAAH